MFKIDVEALARTGAQIRLGEIQTEISLLCGAFPDLCQPEPLPQPAAPRGANPLTIEHAAERGLSVKQYLSMRRNARRARQARARQLHEAEIRARLSNMIANENAISDVSH